MNSKINRIFSNFLAISLMLSTVPLSADEGHHMSQANDNSEVLSFAGQHQQTWHLKATKPLLIGGYGDNFNYDGSNVTPLLGVAEAVFDAEKDLGTAVVNLKGSIHPEKGKIYSGDIMLVFRVKKGGPAFQEGGVADFVFLHGNTKQDAPVMPKTRTFLGMWGDADVYVNNQLVYKNLMGHMMYTERVRDTKSRAIYNKDKSGYYSPQNPDNGSVAAPDEKELHFVAHNMEEDKNNFPNHSVWIHLNFETVTDISAGN